MKDTNIYDIARLAGVSIATVSRVVNGSEKVSEKTKQKVLKVIEEQEYTPNVFAQGLGLNSMHTVGILVPRISDIYMSSAVSRLEEELHTNGYECLLSCSGFHIEDKEAHVQMLLSKRIDALILVGSTYAGSGENKEETDYIRAAAREVPVFLINGMLDEENVYCTVSNDFQASYDVTNTLLENGRKQILFITDSQSYSAKQKLAGYEQALLAAGMEIRSEYKLHTKNTIYHVLDYLKEHPELHFDSAFATDDAMAVGALKYVMRQGKSVPEDVSIIGYNNSTLGICSNPELTSVDNRVLEACSNTVKRLILVLQGNKNVPQQSVLACSLIKRETTDF